MTCFIEDNYKGGEQRAATPLLRHLTSRQTGKNHYSSRDLFFSYSANFLVSSASCVLEKSRYKILLLLDTFSHGVTTNKIPLPLSFAAHPLIVYLFHSNTVSLHSPTSSSDKINENIKL